MAVPDWACLTPRCKGKPYVRQLCRKCYEKERKDPNSTIGIRKYKPYRPKWAKEGTWGYVLWFLCQLRVVPCPTYPELGNCHEWQKSRDKKGYGLTYYLGREVKAHRVAFGIFALLHGRRPNPSLQVLHDCDNPSCCNPKHLKEGTHGDNMRDMVERGRQQPKRWTDDEAKAIIKDLRGGRMSLARVEVKHGGNVDAVSLGRHGKGSYGHLQHLWGEWGSLHGNRKFTFEQANAMRAEVAAGASLKAVGRNWGTSGTLVGHIVRFENAYAGDRNPEKG